MSSFFDGFAGVPDELVKQWANKHMGEKMVDVNKELADLHKIYKDALTHLDRKESEHKLQLVNSMRRYIEVFDERHAVLSKLHSLQDKISAEKDESDDDQE